MVATIIVSMLIVVVSYSSRVRSKIDPNFIQVCLLIFHGILPLVNIIINAIESFLIKIIQLFGQCQFGSFDHQACKEEIGLYPNSHYCMFMLLLRRTWLAFTVFDTVSEINLVIKIFVHRYQIMMRL